MLSPAPLTRTTQWAPHWTSCSKISMWGTHLRIHGTITTSYSWTAILLLKEHVRGPTWCSCTRMRPMAQSSSSQQLHWLQIAHSDAKQMQSVRCKIYCIHQMTSFSRTTLLRWRPAMSPLGIGADRLCVAPPKSEKFCQVFFCNCLDPLAASHYSYHDCSKLILSYLHLAPSLSSSFIWFIYVPVWSSTDFRRSIAIAASISHVALGSVISCGDHRPTHLCAFVSTQGADLIMAGQVIVCYFGFLLGSVTPGAWPDGWSSWSEHDSWLLKLKECTEDQKLH